MPKKAMANILRQYGRSTDAKLRNCTTRKEKGGFINSAMMALLKEKNDL